MTTFKKENVEEIGTVYVLGMPYTVLLADDLVMSDSPKSGALQNDFRRIYIERDLGPSIKMCVLVHEIIHAIDHSIECRLNEEDVVRLEAGIASFILDERNEAVMEALNEQS